MWSELEQKLHPAAIKEWITDTCVVQWCKHQVCVCGTPKGGFIAVSTAYTFQADGKTTSCGLSCPLLVHKASLYRYVEGGTRFVLYNGPRMPFEILSTLAIKCWKRLWFKCFYLFSSDSTFSILPMLSGKKLKTRPCVILINGTVFWITLLFTIFLSSDVKRSFQSRGLAGQIFINTCFLQASTNSIKCCVWQIWDR